MPEMEALPRALRRPWRRSHPAHIQRNILEDQVELWWFREPRKSLLCYCLSVGLILGCGLGGVGLLSSTTSPAGEWRLGAGTALCLLSLAVLLKQLLSSAVQDMNCVRSWRRIELLKSGGLSDVLVVLLTGLALLICGLVLLHLALASGFSHAQLHHNDMFLSGVVLLVLGGVTVLAVAGYYLAASLLRRQMSRQRLQGRAPRVFTISGQMRERQQATTSSMANLI
ncbi:transmembrane protein 125 [Brienomyrus brachyistius]|uniref:transmembrane protein 125 n=1 Tax=Brienomyrus brachyistius TaxID=42636 RepID=UPI0020B30D51|nr:transmembrane protein 125 [Brienomyrus brachyistius]XP_048845825.1 transmembrane protein 125 [Brienomyrus brachyistius]